MRKYKSAYEYVTPFKVKYHKEKDEFWIVDQNNVPVGKGLSEDTANDWCDQLNDKGFIYVRV